MGTDQHLPLYRRRSPRRGVGADRHLRPPTATGRSRELTRATRDQLAVERLSPASGVRGKSAIAAAGMERLWSPAGANRWQLGGKWDALENRLYGRSATGGHPRQAFELFGCHARAG